MPRGRRKIAENSSSVPGDARTVTEAYDVNGIASVGDLDKAIGSLPSLSQISKALCSSSDDDEIRVMIVNLTLSCINVITGIVARLDMNDERSRIAALNAMDTLLRYLRFIYECSSVSVDNEGDDPVVLLSRLTGIDESEIRKRVASEARISRIRTIIGNTKPENE